MEVVRYKPQPPCIQLEETARHVPTFRFKVRMRGCAVWSRNVRSAKEHVVIGAPVGNQDHCENVGHAWCCSEFRQTNCVGST